MILAGDLNDFPDSDVVDALTGDGVLTDLTTMVPSSDRYSFTFGGDRVQLDYIMASEPLAASVESIEILHGPEVEAASDHSPVRAEFLVMP